MKKYKILFFLTAISQIFSSFFTNFSGGSNFNQLLITPAPYTFSIWGAITIFSCFYAFWHLFFDRHHFSRNFYLLLSLVYICFTIWLMAAERALLFATLIIILAMFISLLSVFREAKASSYRNLWDKIFLLGGVGMYLGWVSIASVLNLAVFTFSLGIQNISAEGIYLQMFFVLLLSLSAAGTLYKTSFSKVVFGTHWWAFVGLLIGLFSRDNTTNLILFTIICVLGLNLYYFKSAKM